jgi:DnaD/phage-associated family protein
MDRATKTDLRVLLTLCAKPALTAGNSFGECVGGIAAEVGCTPAQVEASLSFWRGAGVLNVTEENEKPDPAVQSIPEEIHTPEPPKEEPKETAKSAKPQPTSGLPRYTSAELAKLLEAREETATYLRECQNIWGKMFNTHEHNIILGLVDYLGLDWDYVLALLSYAAKYYRERENKGKSLQYVENMAFAFHKEGIVTAEALQSRFKEMEAMSSMEYKLRQLFGMGDGALTPTQKKHFSTWVYDYRFDMEIIRMAYNRAVDNTGSTKITKVMNYMNKSLSAWNDENLRTREQIEAADAAYRAERDGEKATKAQAQSGSFNTDDFFAAAVRRSLGEDFDPNSGS